MAELNELMQSADWKSEKHVPVIDCPDEVKANEMFEIKASLGKEVSHPNTTEHHIRWISFFFLPEGEKNPLQIGHFEFSAHGESVQGPNEGSVYTHHEVSTLMKTGTSGTLMTLALCNIHGLWRHSKEIKVG